MFANELIKIIAKMKTAKGECPSEYTQEGLRKQEGELFMNSKYYTHLRVVSIQFNVHKMYRL